MEDNQSFLELQIDDPAAIQLHETSKWGKFLAIAVLSALGLFVILVIVAWSQMGSLFQTTYGDFDERNMSFLKMISAIFFGIAVVVAVILMVFLLKGANAIKTAVRNKDGALFNTGLGNIRNYFAMMGILSLLFLVLRLIIFFIS